MRTRFVAILLVLGVTRLFEAAPSLQGAEPSKAPAARVAVDPRVELLSLIFRLAGNPEYSQARVESYAKDVDEHFAPFREHAVIKHAQKLRRTRGVSFDACMSMAVHLTDVETLQEKAPFDARPEGLDSRWPLDETRVFLAEARQFVKESRFQEFFAAHQTLYRTAEKRMQALLDKEAHLEWFDEFFGVRPKASFTVALGMLNGGSCYGPHCRLANGKEELYCILGIWKTDDKGLPVFDASMLETIIHEFCHSYANRIVDEHQAELKAAGEVLFPRVAAAMRRQAYGNWLTMMRESLVRACTIRYMAHYHGPAAGLLACAEHRQRQFLWIGNLAEQLKQYEAHRDQYPTLDCFFPQILAVFNDYAERFKKDKDATPGQEPPNGCACCSNACV
jgi:hypothetical protein